MFKVGDKIKWKKQEFFENRQDRAGSLSKKAKVSEDTILTVKSCDGATKVAMVYCTPDIGGWYAARFELVEEKVKEKTHLFKIGDKVKIKDFSKYPVFGLGMAQKTDVGIITRMDGKTKIGKNTVDFYVDFPEHTEWHASASEMELVVDTVKTPKAPLVKVKKGAHQKSESFVTYPSTIPVNKGSRQMAEILKKYKGSFVSVTFIKKDGTERVLNGRYKSSWGDNLTMYDNQKEGYRNVHIDKIISIRAGGLTITLS